MIADHWNTSQDGANLLTYLVSPQITSLVDGKSEPPQCPNGPAPEIFSKTAFCTAASMYPGEIHATARYFALILFGAESGKNHGLSQHSLGV